MGQYLIPRLFVPVAWWQNRAKWKKKHLCDCGCIMPHPNVWNICYDLEKQGVGSMKYCSHGRYDSRWRCRHLCTRCHEPCNILLTEITSNTEEGLEAQINYYEWKEDFRMVEYCKEKYKSKYGAKALEKV